MCNSIYWLWLTMLPGIGPVTAHRLIEKYESAKLVYENRYNINVFQGVTEDSLSLTEAERVMEECEKKNISIITYDNMYYKEKIKIIDDFPMVMFAKGNISLISYPGIGIVGARRCSEKGKRDTIEIAKRMVEEKKVVISGLAKGVDSYAHTAAIKLGGKAIAVLGNGVDICYPSEHQKLYQTSGECGLLLSEYPPGTCPKKYNFPKRNRIIAGMSDALYVVEAAKKSGTRSTIDAANKYGKRVIMVNCYEQTGNTYRKT